MSNKFEILLHKEVLKSRLELIQHIIDITSDKDMFRNIIDACAIILEPLLSDDNITNEEIITHIRNSYDGIGNITDQELIDDIRKAFPQFRRNKGE